jgi:hypothetical protein
MRSLNEYLGIAILAAFVTVAVILITDFIISTVMQ